MSAEIACLLQDPIFGHVFFLTFMIFTWNWEDMSLFECKRSDSVLYNVILIARGTIFFYSPKCASVNTLPFNWYFEGSVLGEGMCLKCLFMLTSFN